jgi:hypothetical protein
VGGQFVRLDLRSPSEPTKVSLRHQTIRRAADLVSTKKGTIFEIDPGDSIAIETRGDDESWLQLNAKANKTYVLRTSDLRSDTDDDIDTVIELYDPSETRKLAVNDDGGADDGGEKLSSRLVISPSTDTSYHIRIRNADSGRGTFNFDVFETQQ